VVVADYRGMDGLGSEGTRKLRFPEGEGEGIFEMALK
jgi:hypothetical protein